MGCRVLLFLLRLTHQIYLDKNKAFAFYTIFLLALLHLILNTIYLQKSNQDPLDVIDDFLKGWLYVNLIGRLLISESIEF
jgi:hypothetical protein